MSERDLEYIQARCEANKEIARERAQLIEEAHRRLSQIAQAVPAVMP